MKRDWVCGVVVASCMHGAFFFSALPMSGAVSFDVMKAPASVEVSLVSVRNEQKQEGKSKKVKEESREMNNRSARFPNRLQSEKKQKEEKPQKPVVQNAQAGAITKAQVQTSQNVAPRYPRVARERGYEGVVMLRVTVTVDGFCENVSVKKSSGYRVLDTAAITAVKTWRCAPAERAGIAFESAIVIPVEFRLK